MSDIQLDLKHRARTDGCQIPPFLAQQPAKRSSLRREAYRRARFTERRAIGDVGYATNGATCAAAALGSGALTARRRSQLLAVLRQSRATLRRRRGGPKSAGMCASFEVLWAWSARERRRALREHKA